MGFLVVERRAVVPNLRSVISSDRSAIAARGIQDVLVTLTSVPGKEQFDDWPTCFESWQRKKLDQQSLSDLEPGVWDW